MAKEQEDNMKYNFFYTIWCLLYYFIKDSRKEKCEQCGHALDRHKPYFNGKVWQCASGVCYNWSQCEKPKRKK